MQDNNDHEADRSRSLHVRLGSVRNPIPRRLADLLGSGRENINGGISFDSQLRRGGSETYISLNEVIQNNRERIETRSTERYFSPDDVGSEQRQETTHEVRHVHFNPQQQNGTDGPISQVPPSGIIRPITREETFHSRTTTLVGSRRESIAEENVESSTPTINITDELGFDVDDADLFAVSPILGMTRLPSLYDAANHVHNSSESSQRPIISTPLSARLPTTGPPLDTAQTSSDTDHEEPQAASNSKEGSPPSTSSSSITEPESTQDNQTTTQAAAANEPTTVSNENQQSNEGVVESSLLLQVSIVGRSSENLPIALEDNNHSTLEYVQFIETASYRQYSFTSEHLNVPEGFLRRSTSGIRRMLSARNRFIAARSRSFLRRLQREVDLEMQNPDAAWQEPDNQPEGPIELEAIPAGPFEVGISSDPEDWGRWGARPELARGSTFTRHETMSRMTCGIFGPNLPRQLGQMCKVYMKQLDDQLSTSIRNYELQTPNFLNWPNPLSYLSECLKLVAKQMEAAMSIEDFVQLNLPHLRHLMAQGPGPARGTSERDNLPVQDSDFVKLAHEWMLFCLEAWTMLDMTAICKNRHDLRLSDNFCKSPLKDTIESLLPRLTAKYTHHFNAPLPYTHGKATQIFPHEMTAEMLQDLGGVTFVWTNDIAQHLALDTKMKTVGVYSHVAFAYLHAEAGTDSSLSKSGLTTYHHLLTEITESYRLLFGSSERSRKIFHNLDSSNRSPGYFDIFTLHNRPDNSNTTKPKWLYNTVDDFPVFGDRLIELRGLLKPKGLRGLWRDTRDSLQWYTFWAVAIIGAVSLLLGFIQMALGAVQAYASLKALGD